MFRPCGATVDSKCEMSEVRVTNGNRKNELSAPDFEMGE